MPPSFKTNFSALETTHFEFGGHRIRDMRVTNDGAIGIHYVDQKKHIVRCPPAVVSLEV
jgi:hypothetical protein